MGMSKLNSALSKKDNVNSELVPIDRNKTDLNGKQESRLKSGLDSKISSYSEIKKFLESTVAQKVSSFGLGAKANRSFKNQAASSLSTTKIEKNKASTLLQSPNLSSLSYTRPKIPTVTNGLIVTDYSSGGSDYPQPQPLDYFTLDTGTSYFAIENSSTYFVQQPQ